MAPRFGDQILEVFDVAPDAYEFLASVLEQRTVAPDDLKTIFDESLIAGSESWYHEITHALSTDRHDDVASASSHDVGQLSDEPWKTTDRLIQQAQNLAREAALTLLPPAIHQSSTQVLSNSSFRKRKADITASQYWCDDGDGDGDGVTMQPKRSRLADVTGIFIPRLNVPAARLPPSQPFSSPQYPEDLVAEELPSIHNNAGTSPYFTGSPPKPSQDAAKRPAAGTVSCIPFPPLNADSFGIIQEQVAHEPFWLLIAVTFLIKTSGQLAIPAYLRVKERFTAPCDIADPANAAHILDMIRHLGLGQNRLRFMQKYAQAFMFDPPRPGVRYRVHGYEGRDVGSGSGAGSHAEDDESASEASQADGGWEIGHLTQGRYAIDSWRIFCRDVLLGRARDWDGKGREAEFQPEWMRVMPADKELRAYLRWMWMREGWEWDPATGERTVLREELRRAVNEGRIEYNEHGGLRIMAGA